MVIGFGPGLVIAIGSVGRRVQPLESEVDASRPWANLQLPGPVGSHTWWADQPMSPGAAG